MKTQRKIKASIEIDEWMCDVCSSFVKNLLTF